ncbi:MAG: DUF4386 family protein [Mycobacterium sp.]
MGGVAGIGYVLVAVAAGAVTGVPPQANGDAAAYQSFIIEKHNLLTTQAWLYALSAALWLMFAVAVRRILRKSDDGGYLSELFLVGSTATAGLLVVAMAMQLVVAQRAEGLPAEVVFTVGVHFPGVLIGLWGFIMAATAFAYAFCVFASGMLPRWTGYLAVLAVVVSLTATAGVFFRTGPFCLEGGFSAWAPALTTVLWYLGTSIAMLRTPATDTSRTPRPS